MFSEPAPSRSATPAAPRRGAVVTYVGDTERRPDEHERVTLEHLGRRVAALLAYDYLGPYAAASPRDRPLFFVPRDTLTSDEARALGVRGREDLLGGIVPHRVAASKLVMRPLVAEDARTPPGWRHVFTPRMARVALPGHSTFCHDDAWRAGRALLPLGRVRLKPGDGVGGHGQCVVDDEPALAAALAGYTPDDVARHGLVVEMDLADAVTYSIGQIRLGGRCASYCGRQRTTRDHAAREAYGGSELCVVRGGYAELLALALPMPARLAVMQVREFDAALHAVLPGLEVSRDNYDVIQGTDAAGRPRSGVLEQSWRVGGASPAELAALEAFDAAPHARVVRAATVERYGADAPPPGATVHYRGHDPRVGPLVKFTTVECDEHASRILHDPR